MHTHVSRTSNRGLTLIEFLVVLAVIVVGIAVFLPFAARPNRGISRQLRDSTHIRSAVQSLVLWADANKGSYPLPSDLDTNDATVPQTGEAKNTTANIFSILIFNGHIVPEMCVSPSEVNPLIQRRDDYMYTNPPGAQRPADALWDPSFRGTPDDPVTYANLPYAGLAHQSYAHLLPFGNRRTQWSDTANATEAVFGNRGPTYAANDAAPAAAKWTLQTSPLGTGSNTLLIHGGRTTWEGNIGYNDMHVNFETRPAPEALTIAVPAAGKKAATKTMPDNLFVSETDQLGGDGDSAGVALGTNAYLRPISSVLGQGERVRVATWRD